MTDARTDKERLRLKNQVIARLREQLARERRKRDAHDPSRLVWIFGSARTGSTWLGGMLGDLPNSAFWSEPAVGALFGEFYFDRFRHRRGGVFIFGDRHKDIWLDGIRSMTLQGVAARHGSSTGYVAINEPHGTVGAPLLSEALPESRLVLLVRDPRDVVASQFDAQREGGWSISRRNRDPRDTADTRPDFFPTTAKEYLWNLEHASEAFKHHEGPKAIVRYEDLRADTHAELRRLRDELSLDVDDGGLAAVVEAHQWSSVPEEKKGPGQFHRKASPGSWKDDLSADQIRIVEQTCAPVLSAFYNGKLDLTRLESGERKRVQSARVLWERLLFATGRAQ